LSSFFGGCKIKNAPKYFLFFSRLVLLFAEGTLFLETKRVAVTARKKE